MQKYEHKCIGSRVNIVFVNKINLVQIISRDIKWVKNGSN